jgi:hypothetical protein
MLNVPKNIASWSVSGMACFAIALNCQASTVVVSDDSRITAPIAFRYRESAMISRAARTPPFATPRASGPAAPSSTPDAGRCRQTCTTMPAQTICDAAVNSNMISVPYWLTARRVARPPTIQPRMAPLPISPNVRLASRVVRMKFASIQTCAGARTDNTPTQM